MNNCPIFVNSVDAYADLWPVFFDLFKINWPEYNGIIYLNTEEKSFRREGLNIKCTRVGRLDTFGNIFRAGLDYVKSDKVLLIMIDFIFMGKVNNLKMEEYYDYFTSSELDSLCLVHQDYREFKPTTSKDIQIVIPPSRDMFSYQIAFWDKRILREMALPHENRWTSEWYGTKRANKMKISLGCLSETSSCPVLYDLAGCLNQGNKWSDTAIDYLQAIKYHVNFEKRGRFELIPHTIKRRLKVKWMLIKDGLKGSYMSVIKPADINSIYLEEDQS